MYTRIYCDMTKIAWSSRMAAPVAAARGRIRCENRRAQAAHTHAPRHRPVALVQGCRSTPAARTNFLVAARHQSARCAGRVAHAASAQRR